MVTASPSTSTSPPNRRNALKYCKIVIHHSFFPSPDQYSALFFGNGRFMTYFLPRMENTAFAPRVGGGVGEGGLLGARWAEADGGGGRGRTAGKFSQNSVKISVKNENSVRKIPENS